MSKSKFRIKHPRRTHSWWNCRRLGLDSLKQWLRRLVKNRSSSIAEQQRSWHLKRWSRTAFFYASCAFVATGCCVLSLKIVMNSESFQINDVHVSGNRMVSREEILAAVRLCGPANLLSLDVAQLQGQLGTIAWIKEVRIERIWPTSLRLSITEQTPMALINFNEKKRQQLYYINAEGHIFAPATQTGELDFPVITGPIPATERAKLHLEGQSLAAEAFYFLQLTARGNPNLPIRAISEVHLDPREGLIVYLVDQPFPIYLGKDKIKIKYQRLVKLLKHLYKREKVQDIASIRLDYSENQVLVAMVEPQQ